MSCNLTYGLQIPCIDSFGGIKGPIYISSDADLGTLTESSTAGQVSLVTAATGDSGNFYEFALPKDTASFTQTGNVSNVNGTLFFDQAISFNLQKMSANARNQMLLICKNRNLRILFQDNNNAWWLVGYSRGAVVTANTGVTGTAPGDANQFTFTISAQEPQPAYQVSPDPETVFTGCDFIAAA